MTTSQDSRRWQGPTVSGALLFRPAGARTSLLHVPTVCASGTARVGYYCFVPPEQAVGSYDIGKSLSPCSGGTKQ